MKKLILLTVFLVACSGSKSVPIVTVGCFDNAPACLSAPACLGQPVGMSCGSAGGQCTALPNQPLFTPCCSCDNSGGGGGNETSIIYVD